MCKASETRGTGLLTGACLGRTAATWTHRIRKSGTQLRLYAHASVGRRNRLLQVEIRSSIRRTCDLHFRIANIFWYIVLMLLANRYQNPRSALCMKRTVRRERTIIFRISEMLWRFNFQLLRRWKMSAGLIFRFGSPHKTLVRMYFLKIVSASACRMKFNM